MLTPLIAQNFFIIMYNFCLNIPAVFYYLGPVVSTILRPDLWRLTQSPSTTYISTILLKPFEKSLHYKCGDVMKHTVPLLTRPVHMVR